MAKSDDRSNNAERIENTIGHTLQNIDKTREYMNAHSNDLSDEEKQQLEQKNQNRKESINSLREEIKDEVNHHENEYK
ncbi:small acid-soluble spore protein Tlp [Alkalihalobacillus sp. 1P02AB]|uniref:small acid-soluble spore protein Tlp n=1 Tax=Alkalihalobacillus sp. 1P02AB TaxID=3132260 RepID=UPI0039A432AD